MSTKNELSRISIDIPKAQHRRLKRLAADLGISMRQIILDALDSLEECRYSQHIPNEETVQAIEEARERKNCTEAENAIGAHIAETKARIGFIADTNISSLFNDILLEYNSIIERDMPNQRRFWKIEGFAQVPCGGTHVKSTAEVGSVALKREHPGRSIERIEIRLVDDSAPNPQQ